MSAALQAVILCGGLGTRLKALFPDQPKGLVPVAGEPFLLHQCRWLLAGGITQIHLAAGHQANQLADWAKSVPFGERVTWAVEPEPRGTAGALKFAAPAITTDPFLVLNGDSLTPNLDLAAFRQALGSAEAMIAVTPIAEAGRFGTVEFDAAGRVSAFREKATRSAGWVNSGVYLFRRGILDLIPEGRPCSMETEVFPNLVTRGSLSVFRAPPPLLDMGTPEGLAAMEKFILASRE